MGLFGFMQSKDEREKNALRKMGQKLTQKFGPPENRQKVIHQLSELGSQAAYEVLCQRFTIRCDIGITDDDEKDEVRGVLVDAGAEAVEPVKRFLEKQESGVAWGLRVLSSIVKPDEVVATVTGLLTRLGQEYTRDPEKKIVLLSWLKERHSVDPRLEGALLPLLEDFSDDVRISTAAVLAIQPPTDPAREGLIQLLLRSGDNARVRAAVLLVLSDWGADVKGFRPSVEPLLVEPYYLDKEGRVKRRG